MGQCEAPSNEIVSLLVRVDFRTGCIIPHYSTSVNLVELF